MLERFSGLDLLSSAVLALDADWKARYLNPAAENLLAHSGKNLIGKPLAAGLRGAGGLFSLLSQAGENGWSYHGQNIELIRSDGQTLHVNCTVTPLDWVLDWEGREAGNGRGTGGEEEGGLRFLVELWPIDQQLKAQREAQLSEQQEASRELIRNLAHEIKNPLGGIRGAAQLLDRELPAPELREYTQVIIGEADRLQNLMQRLLTPHRPLLPQKTNIHEILEQVRTLLLAEFPAGLSIQRDYDTSLPEILADREQLIQVVLNIARNAAQALGVRQGGVDGADGVGKKAGGGEIVLRTRAARQVTLVKKRCRLVLELSIIDNGPGIPEEFRERIFYPLVSGRTGGSGLGLTIAQNFVHYHHGSIECESVPGATAFIVRLPIDPPPLAAKE